MIYDQADIVARRLLGQKVGERVYYETAKTSEDIQRILHTKARVVITAPRQIGKTDSLLKYAENKNPDGQFCVVSPNAEIQRKIIHSHWMLRKPLEVNPPLMLTPDNLELLRGHHKPVYVDEYNSLPEDAQKAILDSGLFVAAVTS